MHPIYVLLFALKLIEITISTFVFVFSHINTKIEEIFAPNFTAPFFEFNIIRIITSDIFMHTLGVS